MSTDKAENSAKSRGGPEADNLTWKSYGKRLTVTPDISERESTDFS